MTNSSRNDSKNKEIIIKIEEVQNATIIKGYNFFEPELDQAIKLINYILKHTKDQSKYDKDRYNYNYKYNWFHQHNTISVLGPRGVGKTSFLLTLRDRIENFYNYSKYNNFKELKEKKIIWLPNLDPTRMEENETFLVTVVANIISEIKKSKDDLNLNVREALKSLGPDFAVLVSAQVHEAQWKELIDDPDSFAYEVLNNAHSGITLANNVHNFLKVCLTSLQADIFVQPIDDIDTAIKQGWPILETIRKYLASPHLITIVTGDIDLYETLIRNKQLDYLSHLVENDVKIGEDVAKIRGQVAQLTEQYLAKVIPSHLRIRLKPIADLITQQGIETLVSLQFDDGDDVNAH